MGVGVDVAGVSVGTVVIGVVISLFVVKIGCAVSFNVFLVSSIIFKSTKNIKSFLFSYFDRGNTTTQKKKKKHAKRVFNLRLHTIINTKQIHILTERRKIQQTQKTNRWLGFLYLQKVNKFLSIYNNMRS